MKQESNSQPLPLVGETIRIESQFGIPGSGVCRVEDCSAQKLIVSARTLSG